MSALRLQLPRLLLRGQYRTASVVNARFYQSSIQSTVLSKYQEKLNKKLQTEGVKNYEELKSKYADKIAAVRKEASVPEVDAVLEATQKAEAALSGTPAAAIAGTNQPFQPPPPPPTPQPDASAAPTPNSAGSPIADAARGDAPPGVKTLGSFVDVEALRQHEPKEIELIWRARFVGKEKSLYATVRTATYRRMAELGREHPMFVLPLPRKDQGVEMHLLQWTFPHKHTATVLFTSLAEYKLRGEFAAPHTTLTHHLELAEEKGMVLAQGMVVGDVVSLAEAQVLLVGLQRFYGALEDKEAGRRRGMVEAFGRGDESFKIEELIKEAEKIV